MNITKIARGAESKFNIEVTQCEFFDIVLGLLVARQAPKNLFFHQVFGMSALHYAPISDVKSILTGNSVNVQMAIAYMVFVQNKEIDMKAIADESLNELEKLIDKGVNH